MKVAQPKKVTPITTSIIEFARINDSQYLESLLKTIEEYNKKNFTKQKKNIYKEALLAYLNSKNNELFTSQTDLKSKIAMLQLDLAINSNVVILFSQVESPLTGNNERLRFLLNKIRFANASLQGKLQQLFNLYKEYKPKLSQEVGTFFQSIITQPDFGTKKVLIQLNAITEEMLDYIGKLNKEERNNCLDKIAESYTSEITKANHADDLKLAEARTDDYLVVCRLIAQKFKIKHYLYQAIREKLVNILSSHRNRDAITSCIEELVSYVSSPNFEKEPSSIQCYTLCLIAKGFLINYQLDKAIAYLEQAASLFNLLEKIESNNRMANDIITTLEEAKLLKENSLPMHQGSLKDNMLQAFIKICNSPPLPTQENRSQTIITFNGLMLLRIADYFGTHEAYLAVLSSFNQFAENFAHFSLAPRLLPSYLSVIKKIKTHELPINALQEYQRVLDALIKICEPSKGSLETKLTKINQIHHKVINLLKQHEEHVKAKERKKIQTKLNQFAAAQTQFVALRVTEKQPEELSHTQQEKETILLEGQTLFQEGKYLQAIEVYGRIPYISDSELQIYPIQAMIAQADCYAALAQFAANEQAKELEHEHKTKAKDLYKTVDLLCDVVLKAENSKFSKRDKTIAEAVKNNLFKEELILSSQEHQELAERTIEEKIETDVTLKIDSQVTQKSLTEEQIKSIKESESGPTITEEEFNKKEPQRLKSTLNLTDDEHTIVNKLTELTSTRENKNASILMIGGAVRDRLALPNSTKKTNLDTEFLIQGNTTLEEIQELFKEYHAKIVGSKIRHVTFKMNGHKYDILITDLSLYDDFKKRHFTHSGLYFDVANQMILDFGNGVADINQRLTRTINNPCEVLANDSTVLLLGFRITSKLDFTFDSEYKSAAQEHLSHLRKLTPQEFSQRITPNFLYAELNKILMSGYAKKIFDYFLSEKLFDLYFPESIEHLREGTPTWKRLQKLLMGADKRTANNQSNNAILILAVIFYEPFQKMFKEQNALLTQKNKLSEVECFNRCIDKFFPNEANNEIHRLINIYLRDKIRFIWLLNELRNEKTPGLLMKMDKSYSAPDVLTANYFQSLLAKEQQALNLVSQGIFGLTTQWIPKERLDKEQQKINKDQPEAPPKTPGSYKEATYPGTVFGIKKTVQNDSTLKQNTPMELN